MIQSPPVTRQDSVVRPAAAPSELDGILNINKPEGLSSHDVVYRVRRITGQRKVGHAGTLDPLATGVLLLCLGRATRVSSYLMSGVKTYQATIRLGIETETYDREGRVVSEAPVDVQQDEIARVLTKLTGSVEQTPPMYSALKRDGTPLYKLARRGETVELAPRLVEISSLRLVSWQAPELQVEVQCGKGTYIRSLAHEIGARLGCGAHLTGLTRTACGPFRLEQAVTLEQLTEAFAAGVGESLLLPSDTALEALPAVHLDQAATDALANGRKIAPSQAGAGLAAGTSLARAYDPQGRLLALIKPDDEGYWWPHKVFRAAPPGPGRSAQTKV
ncbi:MAG TPA: tRNA pseudouridine(55) synthase TruB [Anaerolineae bacterium]|nr:tRNA pseudouridine(55) synthase TruB [Anaerolineae bacterium]